MLEEGGEEEENSLESSMTWCLQQKGRKNKQEEERVRESSVPAAMPMLGYGKGHVKCKKKLLLFVVVFFKIIQK